MRYTIEGASFKDKPAILEVLKFFNMHHIPSAEMEELDFNCFFVAKIKDHIVGVCGYKILSETKGKTTLLAVLPHYSGLGIGKELQRLRMEKMHMAGVQQLTTNADRPETILWYKKHFGYHQIGTCEKLCSFGLDNVDHWTTMETDLDKYFSTFKEEQRRRLAYMQENDAFPLTPYPPLIINVCLTGMIPMKDRTPHVPISVDDIIEDAVRVYDAGATMVHIHARDKTGQPTPDAKLYDKIIRGIRKERPKLVCCATTSGRNWPDFEKRSSVLYLDKEARPDMASLTTGSLNFITNSSVNSITMIERLAMAMKEQGVKPEFEVFDLGMVNLIKYLERNKVIEGQKFINIILGNINTAPATLSGLNAMIEALPNNATWAVAGLGQFQLPMNMAAILAGGHVRVGVEDSIYYDSKKHVLASNKALVDRITRIASELERPIATPEQTREMLGLKSI